jgi:hypothetical protein
MCTGSIEMHAVMLPLLLLLTLVRYAMLIQQLQSSISTQGIAASVLAYWMVALLPLTDPWVKGGIVIQPHVTKA